VENPAFLRFLQRLRPAYKPPTRYKLAGPLLNAAYTNTKKDMSLVLRDSAKQITVVSDGWTNIRGESIVNYMAVTREHAIFLKSTPTYEQRHNAAYISSELSSVVEELGSENVVAITTDTASNMKAAQDLLGVRYPEILMLGCASHIVNLTVNDIFALPEIQNIWQKVLHIAKYFKGSYILIGLMNKYAEKLDIKRKALQLPGNTRWQGRFNTTNSVIANRAVLREVVADPDVLNNPTADQREKFLRVQEMILDYRFWEQAEALAGFLRPFLEVTLALEGVRPKASRIYAYFVWLSQITYLATSLDIASVKEIIGRRFKQVHRPIYTIAYICDPSARAERPVSITDKMLIEVQEYLKSRYSTREEALRVWVELKDMWDREGLWAADLEWDAYSEYSDPARWWRGQRCSKAFKDLAIYALSINPTSGAAERNWSTHGFLHSKARNRLDNERVEKLVYVFTNLRIRDSITNVQPEYFTLEEVGELERTDDLPSQGALEGDGKVLIAKDDVIGDSKVAKGPLHEGPSKMA